METFNEVSCCVEAPEDYRLKAQYALAMLLMPLGLKPTWVGRDALTSNGIYYGPSSEHIPASALKIPLLQDTLSYFQNRTPYPVSHVLWRFWENERWPVLFGGPGEGDNDFIASSFFWLSGWQEYTVPMRDLHGRFPYEASLQAELGIGAMPCVDAYRERLGRRLQEVGIPINKRTWKGQTWAFCPTHDIDYIRKWRPGMVYREVVQYLIANHLNQSIAGRLKRFGSFLIDLIKPVDVFWASLKRIMRETHQRGGTGTYFFKTDAHGPRDVYYSVKAPRLKRVFNWLRANDFEIGLHPSYYAYNHQGYMHEEKGRLEEASGQKAISIRQHYLRYDASTSRIHVEEGFQIDSTLAFANQEGFRRGTCLPFKVFDIESNEELALWEMPLCMMDGTLFNYRKLDGEQALGVSIELMQWCKRFGGVCVGLWHNMLWDEMDFPGWGQHFLECMDYAVEEGANISSLSSSMDAYLASEA